MKNFVFDEKEHAYFLDGKPLQGVTTILKVISKGDALIQWAANCATEFLETAFKSGLTLTDELFKDARSAHRKRKEKAGEAGTDAHSLIELMVKKAIENGGYITETETGLNVILDSFVKWANENKVKFLESEKRLYSERYWYAGTADLICEINGKLFVGDVKTGSGIYPEYFIQASAYANALVEMGLYEQFGGVVIVNAKKDGSIEIRENYALEGNFEAFKACLTLHRHLEAINPK